MGRGDDAVIVGAMPSDPNDASTTAEPESSPSVVTRGPLVIRTGPGSDRVASVDSVFGHLAMHLGQGNDATLVARTTVRGSALFSGGAGMDRLVGGMNSFNHVRVVGFEAHGADRESDHETDDPVADRLAVFT